MNLITRRFTVFLALFVGVSASMVFAQPARADGGEITFGGGGWGHGIGMSQYGAYGMAKDGFGYKAILTHYYKGTSVKSLSVTSPGSPLLQYDEAIWVGIVWDATSVTFIPRNGKLKICHAGEGVCPMKKKPAAGEVWKVAAAGAGKCVFKKQNSDGDFVKKGNKGDCWATLTLLKDARVEIPGVGTYGHGTMRIRPKGDRLTATKFHVSFSMDLEDYILGIAEMPTSWDKAALKAQAVAARTYAAAKVHQRETSARTGSGVNPGLSSYWKDLCWCHVRRSTSDQAYAGWSVSQIPSWVDAVFGTAGKVVTYPDPAQTSNGVIDAYYGSSTVGVTETLAGGFGSTGSRSYLASVDDHWGVAPEVGNPNATWSAVVSESALISALAATSNPWQASFDYLIDVKVVNDPPEASIEVKGSADGDTVKVEVPGWWLKFGPLGLLSPQVNSAKAVVTGSPHGQLWAQGGGVQSPIESGDRFGAVVASGDFDGDGHTDTAISAPKDGVNDVSKAGLVNVLYGAGLGLSDVGDDLLHQLQPGMGETAEIGDRFGSALGSGDFDGDGKDELAVGVPYEDRAGKSNTGLVHVFDGTSSGLVHSTGSPLTQATGGVPGGLAPGDRFGAALATGDFNNDGIDDLVVGSPGEMVGSKDGAGMVTVIPGSGSGLAPSAAIRLDQGSKGVASAPEKSDEFGAVLATGDIDGDGYDDLAVSSPGEKFKGRSNAGVTHVFFGGPSGLKSVKSSILHQESPGVPGSTQKGDRFGSALVIGDIDGDGRGDLAIGVSGEDIGIKSNAGRVVVVFGSSDRTLDEGRSLDQDSPGVAGKAETGDRFGFSLGIGNVIKGWRSDLIVGVPFEDVSGHNQAGAVNVLPGSAGGWGTGDDLMVTQAALPAKGTVESNDQFGFTVSTADFDKGERSELIVGSPGEALDGFPDAGVIQIASNFG